MSGHSKSEMKCYNIIFPIVYKAGQWQCTGSVSRWSCRQCSGHPGSPRRLLWLVSNAGPAPALAPVLPLATLLQDLQVL